VFNTNSLFLVIDQGGHASRAMVFSLDGEELARSEHPIRTLHPRAQFVEHNAEDLLHSIQRCVADVVAQLGKRAQHIEAAGLATQRSNVVCWDKHSGEALSPIISWQDTRAYDWLEKLDLDRMDIHKSTGLFPSAHYGASKLRWCLDHLDAVKQAKAEGTLCCGPMSSYLAYKLTREKNCVADPVNASRTLLWHIHRKDWDPFLLQTFGIPADLLPACVSTTHDYGTLEVGDLQIPLTVVTGDQSSALFAYGDLQFDTAYVNLGTGAFVSRPSGYALLYARRLLTSVIYSDPQETHYVLEGTVNGAGAAISWLQEQYPVEDLWEKLPQWLERVSDPPLFLNGVSGLASPYWLADFKTELQSGNNVEADYVAVIESIAFLINANIQEMMKFASPPQQVQISGGLANLDGLCQRLADLSRLAIYRPRQCEATARGLAYLVAKMPRHWLENDHGDWFTPTDNVVLDGRFLLWEQAMLQRMRHSEPEASPA
jgi:glycerol kinase